MTENTNEGSNPQVPHVDRTSDSSVDRDRAHGYPYMHDMTTGIPLDEVEQKLIVREPIHDAKAPGGERVLEVNYMNEVTGLMDKVRQANGADATEQNIDKLNQLEERVRYFGDYVKKTDPLFDLTKRYKHQNLLLMAIEARRVQIMKAANEAGGKTLRATATPSEEDPNHRRELRSTVMHDNAISEIGGDLVDYFEDVDSKAKKGEHIKVNPEQERDMESFALVADKLMDVSDPSFGNKDGKPLTYREMLASLQKDAMANPEANKKLREIRREFYRKVIDSIKKSGSPLTPGEVPVTDNEKVLREMRLRINEMTNTFGGADRKNAVEKLVADYKGVDGVSERTKAKLRELLQKESTGMSITDRALKGGELMYRRTELVQEPKPEEKYDVPEIIFQKETVEAPQSLEEIAKGIFEKPKESVNPEPEVQPRPVPEPARTEPVKPDVSRPGLPSTPKPDVIAEPLAEKVQQPERNQLLEPAPVVPEKNPDTLPESKLQPDEAPAPAPVPEQVPGQEPEPEPKQERDALPEPAPKKEKEEPEDLQVAPAALEQPQGPEFKDGIIIAAAATANRLSDQIQAQARHIRAEEAAKGSGWRYITKFLPRTIQNRILRSVFEGREMRYAADVDKAAKQALGMRESVPLALDMEFALKAMQEGKKRLNSQPWYKKWPKKLAYIPLRFISGTTGLIQSPEQWEARGWIRHSADAKDALNEALSRSITEQDSLGNRYALKHGSFRDLDSTRVQQMNEDVLSTIKGETRQLYELPKDIQQNIKQKIEVYANAPFTTEEEKMRAKMFLISDINGILADGVLNNSSIIRDNKERNEFTNSELASNILSVAEDIRENKDFYLSRGEDGKRKLDTLEMKFLAGNAWWGKAREAEATGLFGKSINERLARRLSKRNYRWDRTGHKGINALTNFVKDAGVFSAVYGAGLAVSGADLTINKGRMLLTATPLALAGGALGVGVLNGLKESGVVVPVRGKLYGIGGNYLQEYVQYSHESALGRENPVHAKIRNEMERITVKRMSAEEWINDVAARIEDPNIAENEEKWNKLVGLIADAKGRMRLTDISSKREGMKLAAVQNFIQYKEGKENEQAFTMHALVTQAMAKLVAHNPNPRVNVMRQVKNLSLVRSAQLQMGDNIDAIIRTVSGDSGTPLLHSEIRDLNHFLENLGFRVTRDESLDEKNRVLAKLSYKKGAKAFVATAVTAGVVGLAAPVVMPAITNTVGNVIEHGDDWAGNVVNAIRNVPDTLRHAPESIRDFGRDSGQEMNEWRHILGDGKLPVYERPDGSLTTDMNWLQRGILRTREYIIPDDPARAEVVDISGTKVLLPEEFQYFDGEGRQALIDTRNGEILDLTGGKHLTPAEIDTHFTAVRMEESASTIAVESTKLSGDKYYNSFEIDGQKVNTHIPVETEWRTEVVGGRTVADLVDRNSGKILVDNATFNSDGKFIGKEIAGVRIFGNGEVESKVVSTFDTKTLEGGEALKGWKDMSTKIEHGERWWTNNTSVSDANELRLYDRVDVVRDSGGNELRAVTLEANNVGWAQMGDVKVNATDIALKDNNIYFTFRLAGHFDEPIIIHGDHGLLKLDPTDTANFVFGVDGKELIIDGHKVTVAEFSKMVLNQDALAGIPAGNLASEYTNRLDVFNLQPDGVGKTGFISSGFLDSDGSINQLNTIRGKGDFDSISILTTDTNVVEGKPAIYEVNVAEIQTPTPTSNVRLIPGTFPNLFTPESWFTNDFNVAFTPFPLYARQNMERSIKQGERQKQDAEIEEKENEKKKKEEEKQSKVVAPEKKNKTEDKDHTGDHPAEEEHSTNATTVHNDTPASQPHGTTPVNAPAAAAVTAETHNAPSTPTTTESDSVVNPEQAVKSVDEEFKEMDRLVAEGEAKDKAAAEAKTRNGPASGQQNSQTANSQAAATGGEKK